MNFHPRQRVLYSQLFAYALANIHSNARDGNILKVNCYNGVIDNLQINVSQSPLELLNLVKQILKLVDRFPSHDVFSRKLEQIHNGARAKIETLLRNCGNMGADPSPVRAEFRFPLEKCVSMAGLVDFFFTEEFVQEHAVVLHMADVKKLIKFYVDLLYHPILNGFTQLRAAYSGDINVQNPLRAFLPSISAFESLLTASLFSGNTWSFLPNFLYGRATENRPSLELLKAVKNLNRLDFTGTLWLADEEMIVGGADLLDELARRYNYRNMDRLTEVFNLILKVRSSTTLEEIAKLLWKSYFDFLYGSFPDDFVPGVTEAEYGRLSTLNQGPTVIVAQQRRNILNFPAATQLVFRIERLNDSERMNYMVWVLPHLIAYRDICYFVQKPELDYVLARTAERMGIEFVHGHGDLSHIFTRSNEHRYCKVVRTEPLRLEPMIPEEEVDEYVSGESEIPAGHDVMHEPETERPIREISTPGNLAQTLISPVQEGRPISQPPHMNQPASPTVQQERTVPSIVETDPVRRAILRRFYGGDNVPIMQDWQTPLEEGVINAAGRVVQNKKDFEPEEIQCFCIGYNTFFGLNHLFARISRCSHLGFNDARVFGKVRSNVDLKDLERTLCNSGLLVYDRGTGFARYTLLEAHAVRPIPELLPVRNAPIGQRRNRRPISSFRNVMRNVRRRTSPPREPSPMRDIPTPNPDFELETIPPAAPVPQVHPVRQVPFDLVDTLADVAHVPPAPIVLSPESPTAPVTPRTRVISTTAPAVTPPPPALTPLSVTAATRTPRLRLIVSSPSTAASSAQTSSAPVTATAHTDRAPSAPSSSVTPAAPASTSPVTPAEPAARVVPSTSARVTATPASRTHADRAPSASSSPVTPAASVARSVPSTSARVPTTPAARPAARTPVTPASFIPPAAPPTEELPAVQTAASMITAPPTSSPAAVPSATPTSTTRQSSAPRPRTKRPRVTELSENEQIIKDIITEVYGEDLAEYILNIVLKLTPTFSTTWNSFGHRYTSVNHRDPRRWEQLKQRLLQLNLIEVNSADNVKCNFKINNTTISILLVIVSDKLSRDRSLETLKLL